MGYKTINELLPNQLEGDGIFSRMKSVSTATLPWNNTEYSELFSGITDDDLDLLYAIRSGDKCVPFIVQGDNTLNAVLRAISRKHLYGWNALAKTYLLEYSPLENYRMVEHSETQGTSGNTSTQTHDMTVSGTSGNTQTQDITMSGTNGNTKTHDMSVNGTSSSTDTHNMTVNGTNSSTDTHDMTNKTDSTDTLTHDVTVADTGTVQNSNTRTNEHTVSGGYKDSTSTNTSTTTTDGGTETLRHDDKLAYTDTDTHVANEYVKTTENLVAGFDSATKSSDVEGVTTFSGSTSQSNSTAGIKDTSGYDRERKTIEGESGGYSDTHEHTPNETSYTQDSTTFGKTTTTNVTGSGENNNTERVYNNYSEGDNETDQSTRTDNLEHKTTGTETHVVGTTQTTEGTVTTAGTTTQTTTGTIGNTGENEQKTTGTIIDSSTDSHNTSGTVTNSGTDSRTTTGTIGNVENGTNESVNDLTRSGNIGVTTSQQMLISEKEIIEMREKIIDKIFEDVDKELTIPIWV